MIIFKGTNVRPLLCVILLMLLTLISESVSSQVTAQFSASNQQGCSPLLVQFTNESTGDNLEYYWCLGNGNFSTLQNPLASYIYPGTYEVMLIVSNGFLSDSVVKNITVMPNPEVEIFSDTEQGCMPLNVSLANVLDNPEMISSVVWDFGDGNTSIEKTPEHIYYLAGHYTVSIIVTDTNGCVTERQVQEMIEVFDLPDASFSSSETILCGDSNRVTFYVDNPESDIAVSCWSFGDNGFSFESSPQHVYISPGEYDVQLGLVDSNGCVSTFIREKLIKSFGDIAMFGLPSDTLCKNMPLEFSLLNYTDVQYNWNFGNSETSNEPNPDFSYTQAGDYVITLESSLYDQCYSSHSTNVHVQEISASFSSSPDYICQLPAEVTYNATGTEIANWLWQMGTGYSSMSMDTVIIIDGGFDVYQNYYLNDSLIVTDNYGCRDTIIKEANLTVSLLNAGFIPNHLNSGQIHLLSGCAPLTVDFSDISTYPSETDSIVSYFWDFGDGSSSSQESPTHVFTDPGEYAVTMIITSGTGCSSFFSTEVRVGTPQEAGFSLESDSVVCAGENVSFQNMSTNDSLINAWIWEMGDAMEYQSKFVSHAYQDTGYMNVSLTVFYNGCQGSTYTVEDVVYVNPAVGRFSKSFTCSDVFNYTFSATHIETDNFYWDFGDGSGPSENTAEIDHVFPASGNYEVTLSSENFTTGCTHTISKIISVRNPVAVIQKDKNIECKNQTISFDASLSSDYFAFFHNNEPYNFKWIIDETGEEFYMLPEVLQKSFSAKGEYTIRLVIQDQNFCTDTASTVVKIYSPEAEFVVDTIMGCTPFATTFHNLSSVDTVCQITWNFGDGDVAYEDDEIVHTYNNDGYYSPSLSILDAAGCSSTVIKNNYLFSTFPRPVTAFDKSNACVNEELSFDLLNNYNLDSYSWTFGDGEVSSLSSPMHSYSSAGVYQVNLYAEKNGCATTISVEDSLYVQSYPTANFTADSITSNCYPFLVSFSDQTSSESDYSCYWAFGDGENVSNQFMPEHHYVKPGKFSVYMVATTQNGCSDTITIDQMITISGPSAEIVAPENVCRNQTFEISLENIANVYNFQWDMGDGNTYSDSSLSYSYSNIGAIYPRIMLYADSLHTCDIILSDTVLVSMLLASYTTNSESYCVDSPLQFDNISYGASGYSWYADNVLISNSVTPEYAFDEYGSHEFMLIANDNNGCTDTTAKTLNIMKLPNITTLNDTLICQGDQLLLSAQGGISYHWYEAASGAAVLSYPLVQPDSLSVYYVIGQDENGCINNDSVTVAVQPYHNFWVSSDTSIIVGEAVTLASYSSQDLNFQWSTAEGVICNSCESIVQVPENSTYFMLQVEDHNKCFVSNTGVDVQIIHSYTVDLPSAFTPDGDGINDLIYVRGNGIRSLNYFKIFNQWGEMVFESNDLNIGWDGTYKGRMQGIDTYTYIVEASMFNGSVLEKGGVFSIIR